MSPVSPSYLTALVSRGTTYLFACLLWPVLHNESCLGRVEPFLISSQLMFPFGLKIKPLDGDGGYRRWTGPGMKFLGKSNPTL